MPERTNKMKMKMRLTITLMLVLMTVTAACQVSKATPTLQPGEVEIPFETVVLDENGENFHLGKEQQLLLLTQPNDITHIEHLISTRSVPQVQQVDFDDYSVIALFHLGGGCAGFGVTIERLTLKAGILTVHANDWQPQDGGACAEEATYSPYHLVKVRKADAKLEELALVLQRQGKERTD
jgi:hypothetical protein